MPWYSGEGGLNGLVEAIGGAVRDVSRVRRGWHWDTPRPHSWPEQGAVVPTPASDLGWARQEPVRTLRFLIQRGLLLPFTEAMAHPKVEGREWVRDLERPVIFAANHSSHADTSLILHALGDHARERTVVAAAADYWFKRPLLGNIVSLFLNTFPFSRTGGAQAQLHSSSQLLKSGWNLVLFPEGSRSPDGRIQEFKAGVGHLANETGTPVVPLHIRGAYQIMPKGQKLPLPGPVRVRIGKPMAPQAAEGSRQFTARVEKAVRSLALEPEQPDIQGTWIERWEASRPRELPYEDYVEPALPAPVAAKLVKVAEAPPQPEKPGGRARSAATTPRASRPKRR
jgi:1-acyl-sn-glycerol-3-phosphate acyltransferase